MTVEMLRPNRVKALDPTPAQGPWRTLRITEPNHPEYKTGPGKGMFKQTCALELQFEGDKELFDFADKLAAAITDYRVRKSRGFKD